MHIEKSLRTLLILVIAISIIVILSSYLLSSQLIFKHRPLNTSSTSRPFPQEIKSYLNSNPTVTNQKPEDKEGRTVIYNNKDSPYSGTGTYTINISSPETSLPIRGVFKSWEKIGGSGDRYIILNDPNAETVLPKARVVFSPPSGFGDIIKKIEMTALAVEDLGQKKIEKIPKSINAFSESEISQLIQPGDFMIIFPLIDSNFDIIYDSNRNLYAYWLILRRQDGLKMIKL